MTIASTPIREPSLFHHKLASLQPLYSHFHYMSITVKLLFDSNVLRAKVYFYTLF